MSVEIISDKLTKLAINTEYYSERVTIRDWVNFAENPIRPDILILDLDLSNRTNENGRIPPFFSNIQEIRDCFNRLKSNIIPLLESGRIVIAISSKRTGLLDLSNVDSQSWLDSLQVVQLVQNESARGIEIESASDSINGYFDFVDYSDIGVRIENEVVGNPEILARNEVNGEPFAVALDEYLDPNGIPRQMNGKLVILPQPTQFNIGFEPLIDSLVRVGESYFDSDNSGEMDQSGGELLLHREIFDEELIARCSSQFNHGQYQDAIQNAFIVVEERIRKMGDYSYDMNGVDLATNAFNPDSGELSFGEIESEKRGIMHLYRSGFMAFRNPSSHRFLDDLDRIQAYHILAYANMLLQLLEENQ
jgi:uncharacterized protein (TIGR02391 family)